MDWKALIVGAAVGAAAYHIYTKKMGG